MSESRTGSARHDPGFDGFARWYAALAVGFVAALSQPVMKASTVDGSRELMIWEPPVTGWAPVFITVLALLTVSLVALSFRPQSAGFALVAAVAGAAMGLLLYPAGEAELLNPGRMGLALGAVTVLISLSQLGYTMANRRRHRSAAEPGGS